MTWSKVRYSVVPPPKKNRRHPEYSDSVNLVSQDSKRLTVQELDD